MIRTLVETTLQSCQTDIDWELAANVTIAENWAFPDDNVIRNLADITDTSPPNQKVIRTSARIEYSLHTESAVDSYQS